MTLRDLIAYCEEGSRDERIGDPLDLELMVGTTNGRGTHFQTYALEEKNIGVDEEEGEVYLAFVPRGGGEA